MAYYNMNGRLFRVLEREQSCCMLDETTGNYVEFPLAPVVAHGMKLDSVDGTAQIAQCRMRSLLALVTRMQSAETLSAESVFAIAGIDGHLEPRGAGFEVMPPPLGAMKFRLSGDASMIVLDITPEPASVTAKDIEAVFGHGESLPPVGGRSYFVFGTAYNIETSNSRRSCRLFANFAHPLTPDTPVRDLAIRIEQIPDGIE